MTVINMVTIWYYIKCVLTYRTSSRPGALQAHRGGNLYYTPRS